MAASKRVTSKKRKKSDPQMTLKGLKLVKDSQPKHVKKMRDIDVGISLLKTEELVEKYRALKKGASERRRKTLNHRIEILGDAFDRYANQLRAIQAMARKERRALTDQPKMLVPLKDSAREEFIYKGKKKEYAKETKFARIQNSPWMAISNRISGQLKSQDRKQQVGRDRRKAAREEGT